MATAVKDSHSLRCENCGDRESVTPGIRLCLPCWRILLRVEILGGETAQTLRVMEEYRESSRLLGSTWTTLDTIPLPGDYASEAVHLKAQRAVMKRLQSQFKQRSISFRRKHQ